MWCFLSDIESLQTPFLTIGEDLGFREVRYRGTSEFSGDFVVEDVRSEDGAMQRQLVFLSSNDVVQSQIRLIKGRFSFFYHLMLECIML